MRIADCGLRIADCGLRIADCGLRIADCGLRIADCGLRAGWRFSPKSAIRYRKWPVLASHPYPH
ncbi:MAG: hypothetical protein EPN60_11200 [Nevskiaceae bacterium]|nr:MAG: hypothetical protein EPO48_06980 [Nevskiaceae bacterium]TAM25981.1 MAG: hypothetical protein EPN60_11200 [Nevskiaceae bacterium]